MAEPKVTVSFPVTIRHDSNGGHGYFNNSGLSGIEYGSDAIIKAKLRKRAEAEVAEALRLKAEVRGRIIGCTDGTVLVVRFKYDSWGYAIYGAGRTHGGAVLGDNNFDAALAAAMRHAVSSYGGVAWENSL
jgi:hypothetical protein